MLRKCLLGAAILITATAWIVACSPSGKLAGQAALPPAIGPRIQVYKDNIDFGALKYNEWARPSFQISNTGDADLVVLRTTIETLEGC